MIKNTHHFLINTFSIKDNNEAEKLVPNRLEKKPYSATAWERYGDLMKEKENKSKAIEYYTKSLYFYPHDYSLIKKIKSIQGKKIEIELLIPETLKEMFKTKKVRSIEVRSTLSEKNYITLLKKSCNVVYVGGLVASKYFYFYKILNEAGINEFKEFSNFGNDLMIFKEDGKVIFPEFGYGSSVLTDLKIGDIIGLKVEIEGSSNFEYISNRYNLELSVYNNEPTVFLEEDNLIAKKIGIKPELHSEGNVLTLT